MLQAKGWTFTSAGPNGGRNGRDALYFPPGVRAGENGAKRRVHFFDSKRQVLVHLSKPDLDLAPEDKKIVDQALEFEELRKSRIDKLKAGVVVRRPRTRIRARDTRTRPRAPQPRAA